MIRSVFFLIALCSTLGWSGIVLAAEGEHPHKVDYVFAPPAPALQTRADADKKSAGCMSCHTKTDSASMHQSEGVVLGCVDCHGGDATVFKPEGAEYHREPVHFPHHVEAHHAEEGEHHDAKHDDHGYTEAMEHAHVEPTLPLTWDYPKSKNPHASYTLLNTESPEYVRFVNPSDYRVAREACGACHLPIIQAAERHIMANGAMLFGGGAYNNGVLPFKNYILGEAYTREGEPATIVSPGEITDEFKAAGIIERLIPLPAWETVPPGDIFRVFERGGRNILNLFPEIGLPNPVGIIQRLEEPGKLDIKQSSRGPGTGIRVAIPVLNLTKTRLNDPLMWFLGTNDNPGDFRTSGCGACHVVYANDRDKFNSGPYAKYGHKGETQTVDPTIPHHEPGHPLKHEFTRAIPTSQCMSCHMHQPNVFVNPFLGYTMYDYESDAPLMWPEEQQYPSNAEMFERLMRNPEEAATRGKWGDPEFLSNVWTDINPKAKNTQFAELGIHFALVSPTFGFRGCDDRRLGPCRGPARAAPPAGAVGRKAGHEPANGGD